MSLLHPEFLFALAVLAIPIIIHLFNFRKFKKVVFPNVRFLKKVDLQTRSKNRLKHLLILLSRILALTCLVLAFAKPYLPIGENDRATAQQKVAIYVDNSFSMQAENEDGVLLSQALSAAKEVVNAYGRNDQFLLLTNDLRPEHQFTLSSDEIKDEIDNISISPSARSFSEITERARDKFSSESTSPYHIYYLSDFQKESFDPINLRSDSLLSSHMIPFDHLGQGNIYIDSIWFESPIRSIHSPERFAVRVVNASGKEIYDLPIRLTIDGQQKSIGNMTLKPFSQVDSTLTFTNPKRGWLYGQVSLNDSPISFDDVLSFSYEVQEECNVLVLGPSGATGAVSRVFAGDPFFKVESAGLRSVDVSKVKEQDLVVLAGINSIESGLIKELSRFVNEGGSLTLIPAMDAKLNSINELLLSIGANTVLNKSENTMKGSDLDADHRLFADVFDRVPQNMDYPVVQSFYRFNNRVRSSEEPIIKLQDGTPLLSAFSTGEGHSYIFSSAIDRESSNLGSHSLFITSLLRMAELSAGTFNLYQDIGDDRPFTLRLGSRPSDAVYKMQYMDGSESFIPEQLNVGSETRFFDRGQVKKEGIYQVLADDIEVAKVAYNYNRDESQMEFLAEADLRAELERNGISSFDFISTDSLSSGSPFSTGIAGKQLWRHFLILGLLFLIIEILLLKFWKS